LGWYRVWIGKPKETLCQP